MSSTSKFIKMKIQVRITNFALKELTPGQIATVKKFVTTNDERLALAWHVSFETFLMLIIFRLLILTILGAIKSAEKKKPRTRKQGAQAKRRKLGETGVCHTNKPARRVCDEYLGSNDVLVCQSTCGLFNRFVNSRCQLNQDTTTVSYTFTLREKKKMQHLEFLTGESVGRELLTEWSSRIYEEEKTSALRWEVILHLIV